MARLKHFLRLQYGDALAVEARKAGGVSVYGSNGPVGEHNVRNTGVPAIIVGRKGSHGKVTWAPEGGFCIDTAYYVDERQCAGVLRYAYYLLLSLELGRTTRDTGVPGLDRNEAHNRPILLPDLATQKAIADFLDCETARIDQLIEKKQRFVDVLGRKWAATITYTLTNGLDADAPRKDSGVSWIGDVPENWSVAKLGHIGRCANGINIPGDAFGSGFPFVSYGDVYRNTELPNSVDGLVQSTAEDRARYNLKKGDVLFTRTSETIDEIGFSSVCMQEMPEAVFAGFLIRFRPVKRKLFPAFSKFLFRDDRLRAFFSKEMMIVTRASLSQGLLQRMPVVLPPLEEQQSIADYLQRKENVFVSVSEKTKTSIDRLREYRAALITAAVTGQIDVSTYGKQGATDRRLDRIEEEMQA